MHELELKDDGAVGDLIELCTERIPDQKTRSKTIKLINRAKKTQKLVVVMDKHYLDGNVKTVPLAELAKLLASFVERNGKVSQIDEGIEDPTRCIDGERATALGICSVKQQLPRSIVSAVQTSAKTKETEQCRNFHIQGTLHMKSSAIS